MLFADNWSGKSATAPQPRAWTGRKTALTCAKKALFCVALAL